MQLFSQHCVLLNIDTAALMRPLTTVTACYCSEATVSSSDWTRRWPAVECKSLPRTLLLLLLLPLQINAMPPVVVLIAVDPSDQAEAAFNCECHHLFVYLKYFLLTSRSLLPVIYVKTYSIERLSDFSHVFVRGYACKVLKLRDFLLFSWSFYVLSRQL